MWPSVREKMSPDQQFLDRIARRALALLKESRNPQQEMTWAENRLSEESLLGWDTPDRKNPVAMDGTSDSPEPGPDGPERPVAEGTGQPPRGGGDVRGVNPPANPERRRTVAAEVTEGQTPYEPAS